MMTTIYLVNKKQIRSKAAYRAALRWVDRLEPPHLRGRGESLTAHLYNADGELLVTLDEVVRAILNNELMLPETEMRLAA